MSLSGRPIRIIGWCLMAAWAVALLDLLSETGISFADVAMVAMGKVVVLVALVVRLVAKRRAAAHRRLAITALLLLAGMGAASFALFLGSQSTLNPLFRVRFAVSQPQLERAAAAAAEGNLPAQGSWVGVFRVHDTVVHQNGTRIITAYCGLIDRCGFALLPAGETRLRKAILQPIEGAWYLLYEIF